MFIFFMSNCGIIENNKKKAIADRLFNEYQTVEGDTPYKYDLWTHFDKEEGLKKVDTLLIVKNNGAYYQIDRQGNRTQVELVKVRR